MEMVGKSDPYVLLYVRPLFKYKTQVIDNNLNPIWNETFNLNVEDHETQVLHFQVKLYTFLSKFAMSYSSEKIRSGWKSSTELLLRIELKLEIISLGAESLKEYVEADQHMSFNPVGFGWRYG